jgi:DNA (cytosine-5)-methyltransferase 1
MDYFKKTCKELIAVCKEKGIKGYSNKKKEEIIKLISSCSKPVEIFDNISIYSNMVSKKDITKIKYVDLFCGIGSFHYSFNNFGWECVMSCDIDNTVKKTYKENYNQEPLDDIAKIDPKDVIPFDILCAGFPCQPFSQCGNHKGFDDERGTLFFSIMKFIKFHKPKIIILENVQGLLKHDNGRTFQIIKTKIETEKYIVGYKVLKCSDYGIPQMRKRLFIIGIREDLELKNKLDDIFNFKEYEKQVKLSEFLGKNFEKDIAYTIRCGGKNSPINDKHNWDGYIVDGKEYRLTIEECLKLQGFDSSFKLNGNVREKWKQLGNTIPTIFTQIIGNNINKYYN